MTDQYEPKGPPIRATFSDLEYRLLARHALELLNWDWLSRSSLMRTREEQRRMAELLFGIYLALKKGKMLTKREACDLMGVDAATTGPRYIGRLEQRGLIRIERRPEEDRRKDFLRPTDALAQMVEAELKRLSRPACDLADRLNLEHLVAGIDTDEASRIPLGNPDDPDSFWPPDYTGTPIEPTRE